MDSTPRTKPSILRVTFTDYTALLAIAFPVIFWAMYAYLSMNGTLSSLRGREALTGSDAPGMLYLAIAATVLGIPLYLYRIRAFMALFARGIEVTGTVTYLAFFKDRGRVEYDYAVNNESYHGGRAIAKNARTTALSQGCEVTLIVDPDNPKHAVIRDLYT